MSWRLFIDTVTDTVGTLKKFVGTNPNAKSFMECVILLAQNSEAIEEYLSKLEKAIEKYHNSDGTGDADIMTLEELFEVHPEILSELSADEGKEVTPTELYETLKSVLPKNHVKPNNKLANEITRDFINEGEIELRVSRKGAKKEITTKAILTYEDKNISLSGRAKFTPYDREVHDAVVTLYVAGNEALTPEMVYRAMTGKIGTEKISPQAVGAVTRSLDKSRRIMVNIDFSQEARAYNKNVKATYEGYLLECRKITVAIGGTTKEAYRLLATPILYDYAQVSGQILTVPIGLLQTKKTVRSTEEVIVIRGYLLRQIEGMKSPSFKRSNKITFEGIYKEMDVSTDTHDATAYKNKTRTIRQHVDAILKEWVDQGYIKEYKQRKEGKTIKSIVITLPE